MNNEFRLKTIAINQLKQLRGTDPQSLSLDSKIIEDLGGDSLDTIELVIAVEKAFKIEIPDEDAEHLSTLRDVFQYVGSEASGYTHHCHDLKEPTSEIAQDTSPRYNLKQLYDAVRKELGEKNANTPLSNRCFLAFLTAATEVVCQSAYNGWSLPGFHYRGQSKAQSDVLMLFFEQFDRWGNLRPNAPGNKKVYDRAYELFT